MNFGRFALRDGSHILRSLRFCSLPPEIYEGGNEQNQKRTSKGENMKTTMKSAIEKILSSHGILEAFQSASDYSVRIESKGFIPLCIEKHGTRITVTNYNEQNGKLIPDPDMEFSIPIEPSTWLPVVIQHSSGSYFRALIQDENGTWKANQRQLIDQQSFASMWGRNLLQQGFADAHLVRAEIG